MSLQKTFSIKKDLRFFLILLIILFFNKNCTSQTIQSLSGTVRYESDSTLFLSQVSVKAFEASKSEILNYAFSNNKGIFNIQFTFSDSLKYFLIFSRLGYLNDTLYFNSEITNKTNLNIYLKKSSEFLKEVIVKSNSIIEKNDTLEYKADIYKTPETKKVKDLLSKMDGFSVNANGKISYQGKQIKALLINGDDLTQEQYEIISNNLNATSVDAVQVFDNYSKNRVLGSFYKSGEVAINLKIKNKFEGKWNGSSSIGSSFIERNKIDVNLIYLKPSVKFLFFGNNNNISENVSGNAYSSFESYQNKTDFALLINKEGIVKSSNIPVPDIGNTYTQDIKENFASPLFHYKLNGKIKFTGKISAAKISKEYQSSSKYKTSIDNFNNWEIERDENLNTNQNFINSSFQLSHENGNTLAGNLRFQFFIKGNRNTYLDLSSIAINDTLKELVKSLNTSYGIDYNLTKKLSKNKVVNVNTFIAINPENTINNLQSKRFLKYFLPNDSSNFFIQKTKNKNIQYTTSIYYLYNLKNRIFKYGLGSNGALNDGNSNTLGNINPNNTLSNKLLLNSKNDKLTISNYIFNSAYLNVIEKNSLRISFDGGVSMNNLKKINDKKNINFIYNLTTSFSIKKRAFNNKSISFSSIREMPDVSMFYFNKLFSGNSTISLLPTSYKPIEYDEINLSYTKSKLQSNGSFFISTFLKNYRSDYVNAFRFDKNVGEVYFYRINNKITKGVNINTKTFIFPLKSTINLSSTLQFEKFKTIINEVKALESNININYTFNYITNFKYPINTELVFNQSFNTGTQMRDNVTLKYLNSYFSFQDKIRINVNKKYFIGLQYRLIKFKDQKSINLGDVFSTFNLTKSLSIDLKLFNAFNLKESVRINNNPNNFITQNYNLVNRYLLLVLNYSF